MRDREADPDYRHRLVSQIHIKRMKIVRLVQTSAIFSLLFCSCATRHSTGQLLPAEVPFNGEAGRGDYLFVTLRLKNSEDLLFALDTGAPGTVLDKSLRRKLGRRRGETKIPYPWYGITNSMAIYKSPPLRLGNTSLRTGEWALTDDLNWIWPGRGVKGILGMDCLRNYCVQLDFPNRKVRLLIQDNINTEGLGKAFPLSFFDSGVPWVIGDLMGDQDTKSEVDTGEPNDGSLTHQLFQQQFREQKPILTRQFKTFTGEAKTAAIFPTGLFGGITYTNLKVLDFSENVVGLRFLARHLVTFNFPKRMMYLKQE